jgi:hemoglobin-like flavoprotein
MPITDAQIEHIQRTFKVVAQDADGAAALFYQRLFEIAPQVRPMFKHDMTEQGRKLMQTLSIVVHGLTRLDDIVPAIHALGKRHVDYGVTREQYDLVGEALLWTLAAALGDEWTEDVAKSWIEAYTLVAETATEDL